MTATVSNESAKHIDGATVICRRLTHVAQAMQTLPKTQAMHNYNAKCDKTYLTLHKQYQNTAKLTDTQQNHPEHVKNNEVATAKQTKTRQNQQNIENDRPKSQKVKNTRLM